MPVVGAETHQTLSGVSAGNLDFLEDAMGLRELDHQVSGLDARTFALVKIASLIALDAPPASYVWQIGNALDGGRHSGGHPRGPEGRRAAGRRSEGSGRRPGDHARARTGARRRGLGISDAAVQTPTATPCRRRRRRRVRVRQASPAGPGRAAGAGLHGGSAVGRGACRGPGGRRPHAAGISDR